jgi:hypothetical protein
VTDVQGHTMATPVGDVRADLVPPKHILVKGKRIKFRLVQQIIWSALGAAIGAYMVSALYYLITQVRYPGIDGHTILYLKPAWDHALANGWWPDARHDLRDVYEGVFATLFIRSIITKRKLWTKRVGIWRIVTAPLVLFLAALPVVALGIWIVDIRNVGVPIQIHTYQAYLIGFVAAQVVHRIYAPIGNTVQLLFLEQALPNNRRPRWPAPPVVRERYAWMWWLKSVGKLNCKDQGRWFTVAVSVMVAVLLFLAAYGAYVRLVVAK